MRNSLAVQGGRWTKQQTNTVTVLLAICGSSFRCHKRFNIFEPEKTKFSEHLLLVSLCHRSPLKTGWDVLLTHILGKLLRQIWTNVLNRYLIYGIYLLPCVKERGGGQTF